MQHSRKPDQTTQHDTSAAARAAKNTKLSGSKGSARSGTRIRTNRMRGTVTSAESDGCSRNASRMAQSKLGNSRKRNAAKTCLASGNVRRQHRKQTHLFRERRVQQERNSQTKQTSQARKRATSEEREESHENPNKADAKRANLGGQRGVQQERDDDVAGDEQVLMHRNRHHAWSSRGKRD